MIFKFLQFKGANLYTKIMLWKKKGVTVLVKELKSIVPLCRVHWLKSNIVLSEFARAYSRDYVIFFYAVQDAQCNTEESPLDWEQYSIY